MNKYQDKNNKTEKIIKESLLKLLNTYELKDITLEQIAQQSKMNRVTIYRHFEDKWDILEKIEQDFFQDLLQPHQEMIKQLRKPWEQRDDGVKILMNFLDVFKSNLNLMRILLDRKGDPNFTNKLMDYLLNREKISHPMLGINSDDFESELLSYYEISGLIGIIKFWSIHPEYNTKQIAVFFFNIRNSEIKAINSK